MAYVDINYASRMEIQILDQTYENKNLKCYFNLFAKRNNIIALDKIYNHSSSSEIPKQTLKTVG